MKPRTVCAVLGVAIAAFAAVFMFSLAASNDAQALRIAEKMISALPADEGTPSVRLAIDFRPGGRVMQGPPLTANVAVKEGVEGIAVAKSVFKARRLAPPSPGEDLNFIGKRGSYRIKVSEILPWDRPAGRGSRHPDAFVSPETAAKIAEEWIPLGKPDAKQLSAAFVSDAGRNFDKSRPLLLWAALLTSVCLVVNTLILDVEASRRDIAVMRTLGMERKSVAWMLFARALKLSSGGCAIGIAAAAVAIRVFTATDPETFPAGSAFSSASAAAAVCLAPAVAFAASLASLKTALSVKPLEAASAAMPKRRIAGMVAALAFGFGSFVAVEVWGSSLMSSFVPSKEWPDAIVSFLPAGVSSCDIEKLSSIEGVERIAELQPLQLDFFPHEEIASGRGGRQARNALLLASSFLPDFKFVEGSAAEARKRIFCGFECVITSMMARSRNLRLGDSLSLDSGDGSGIELKIAGIVDLNWHMVTSRGLLRGLGRSGVNTDGPVFVSFDTLAALDPRPQYFVPMTHVWLDYKKDFLAEHGVFESGRIVERRIVEALGGAYLENEEGEILGNVARLHSRDEVADGTLAHGSDIIGSMAKVPFIFIAVAALGFVASTVAGAESRSREFAVMRAVGATRASLVRILASDALDAALKGVAIGAAGGIPVGWLCTFSTAKLMSNWGLPHTLSVPWTVLSLGAAATFAIVLLVAVPAAFATVAGKGKK